MGVGSVFNLGGDHFDLKKEYRYYKYKNGKRYCYTSKGSELTEEDIEMLERDWEKLGEDFERVGEDMNRAMKNMDDIMSKRGRKK